MNESRVAESNGLGSRLFRYTITFTNFEYPVFISRAKLLGMEVECYTQTKPVGR